MVKQAALFPCAFQADVSNPGKPFFFVRHSFSFFFLFGTMCAVINRKTLGPDIPGIHYTWYLIQYHMYLGYVFMCMKSAAAVAVAAAAAALCCYTVVVAAAAAGDVAARHRVPDGKICCCPLNLIQCFISLYSSAICLN